MFLSHGALAIDSRRNCWWTLLSSPILGDLGDMLRASCFVSLRNPESGGSKKFPMELYGTIWNIIEYHIISWNTRFHDVLRLIDWTVENSIRVQDGAMSLFILSKSFKMSVLFAGTSMLFRTCVTWGLAWPCCLLLTPTSITGYLLEMKSELTPTSSKCSRWNVTLWEIHLKSEEKSYKGWEKLIYWHSCGVVPATNRPGQMSIPPERIRFLLLESCKLTLRNAWIDAAMCLEALQVNTYHISELTPPVPNVWPKAVSPFQSSYIFLHLPPDEQNLESWCISSHGRPWPSSSIIHGQGTNPSCTAASNSLRLMKPGKLLAPTAEKNGRNQRWPQRGKPSGFTPNVLLQPTKESELANDQSSLIRLFICIYRGSITHLY